jgi:hypothetical protein
MPPEPIAARLRGLAPYGKHRPAVSSRLLAAFAALARCRSSVVEHSLGKGEVVSSILTGSTTKAQQIKSFSERALPFPPVLEREQSVFPPAKLGENPGNLFGKRSAFLDRTSTKTKHRNRLERTTFERAHRTGRCATLS